MFNAQPGRKVFFGKIVFQKRLRKVEIRLPVKRLRKSGEIQLREKCLQKASLGGNSSVGVRKASSKNVFGMSALGNLAVKVHSPYDKDVFSQKKFGGAHESATLNAAPVANSPNIDRYPGHCLG